MSNGNKTGHRVVVHGQSGLAKREYLEEVLAYSRQRGQDFQLKHVGQMMYDEDPRIPRRKILNVDLDRLLALRRAVDRQILYETRGLAQPVVVSSHAVFRAKLGLIYAGGLQLLKEFEADMYITLIDNVDSVYVRLHADYPDWEITLKDILMWREEEILISEILANLSHPTRPHYVVAREHPPSVIHDLIFNSGKKKAYISFPITLIEGDPEAQGIIDQFRASAAKDLIAFDPLTISERRLITRARNEPSPEHKVVIECLGQKLEFTARELLALAPDIDSQIVARDFKLIDQSDMIIAYVPKLAGRCEISAGVTMEIQHASETGKDVYVVCANRDRLSPFITEHATRIYDDFSMLVHDFERRGYLPPASNTS